MEEKYLPIGSVCTLKGKNRKMMITGYYSVEFNGNLKIKDYLGCIYPEGMLLPDQTASFNHKDIEKIDFLGYKNKEFETFMNMFDKLTGNEKDRQKSEYKVPKSDDMILTSSNSYSKLLFDENGVVMIAEPVAQEPKSKDLIKFDKDGYVISVDAEKDVENPFYKEYQNTLNDKNTKSDNWNIFNKIEFDENGVVISVGEKEEPSEQYKFDENGILISVDNNNEVKDSTSDETYEFDTDGNLIAVNTSKEKEEIPTVDLDFSTDFEEE